DPVGQDYLQRIRDAAARMGGLIESLLDYAGLDRSQLQPMPVDLALLAHLALAELQEALPAGSPPREVRASVSPDLLVQGDERQMRMLVTQLVRHAWNFADGDLFLEIRGQRAGDMLEVTFRDQGRGFDMQYASKLFEPFQRLHGA